MAKLTPMMKQYWEIKDNYLDYILFFRLGDFYEMFFDDAVTAARELEITLTGRNCGMAEKAPLCGVPYHSAEGYIARLVAKGYKVAICEQIEDPATAKGIVKRDVVRVVTPGTIIEPDMLNNKVNNYILSVYEDERGVGLAYADITTAEFRTTSFGEGNVSAVINEIMKINPREVIISDGHEYHKDIMSTLEFSNPLISKVSESYFKYRNADHAIKRIFNVYSSESMGLIDMEHSLIATGSLLEYISETQKVDLVHFSNLDIYSYDKFMILDKFTRRNLELSETIREKSKKGSLLWVLDKTSTAMGARTLRKWIEEPLLDRDAITERLDIVEYFFDDIEARQDLREILSPIYDLERLSSKLVYGNINARDLIALKTSVERLPDITDLLDNTNEDVVKALSSSIDELVDIFDIIDEAIIEEPPIALKDGGIIKTEYHEELAELRDAINNGKNWIIDFEAKEREATGIKSLKVRYNRVFGYYIEVTKNNIDLVPEGYVRKQTLANAERYISEDLKVVESKILGAEDKIGKLEFVLFTEIKNKILTEVNRIQDTAKGLARLDALISMSEVSYVNGYVKPVIREDKAVNIVNGRHPVVERISNEEMFVPNDTSLDDTENKFYIITGPNMAGKSTYLRQVALITLMAQIGCFVPADKCEIGVVDRIFTRVGASDDLSQGQSTFMVEMNELANILHNATSDSLIILDEIGRGTSTYDGLSIAWAVVEYLTEEAGIGAKTMFATHYHELTELEGRFEGVKNYYISVKESGDDIVFLRKILRGGANRSYGIQVANLAGLPKKVINRAKEILLTLEENDINKNMNNLKLTKSEGEKLAESRKVVELQPVPENQISLFDDMGNSEHSEFVDELKNVDVLTMNPIEAMNKLHEIITKAKSIS